MLQNIHSYEDAYYRFEYKWKLIQHLNDVFPKLYQPYSFQTMRELEQRQKASNVTIEEMTNYITESKKPEFSLAKYKKLPLSDEFRNILDDMYDMANFVEGSEVFLREMSLVFLITTFEDFIENLLTLYYKKDLNRLKSKKVMTHEEIIESSQTDKIINKMIEKEIEGIISEDVEKLNGILLDKCSLDFRNQNDWQSFIECFYRRHAIVHNDGIPDEKYRMKTGYSEQSGDRLRTDSKYISESLIVFQRFAKLAMDHFIKKYPLS